SSVKAFPVCKDPTAEWNCRAKAVTEVCRLPTIHELIRGEIRRQRRRNQPARPRSVRQCQELPPVPWLKVLFVVAGSANKSLFLRTPRLALLFQPATHERTKHYGHLCLSHSVPRSGDSEYQRHHQTWRRCNG